MVKIAITCFVLLGLWVFAAWMIPLTQDEAYYALWGKDLQWGYFDHPPMVALWTSLRDLFLGATSSWYQSSLALRIGSILVAFVHYWVVCALYQRWGLTNKKILWVALLLMGTNFFGLVYGVITTPDTGLILFWSLSLYAGTRAFAGERPFWLLTGFFVGCGLWSKYTMAVMGLVLLCPLLWELWNIPPRNFDPSGFGVVKGLPLNQKHKKPRPALLTPWPYLGGLVAFLVFLPHVLWNAEHQWMTFRFQFRHGFSMERPDLEKRPEIFEAQALPRAQPSYFLDREYLASAPFLKVQGEEKAREKTWFAKVLHTLNTYVGFLGSQVALWGFWLVGMIPSVFLRLKPLILRRQKSPQDRERPKNQKTTLDILILASCWVPLVFFLVLSPFTKIEANWSAMYLIGAAALAVRFFCPAEPRASDLGQASHVPVDFTHQGAFCGGRRGTILACLQGAILIVLALHARFHILPLRADRLQKETAGFVPLGETLEEILAEDRTLVDWGRSEGTAGVTAMPYQQGPRVPFFVESYQLASMLRYYFPHWRLRQWPGVTRDSEFSQNPRLFAWDLLDISAAGGFWLLIHNVPIPKIFPFIPDQILLLRDCKTSRLQVIRDPKAFVDRQSLREGPGTPCLNPRRSLYLVRYRT